ncbi:hypothetical protein BG55_13795 [Erwinia mallotivora]|uniref:Uncharacterized protein n=1 Tax=Erwinia mallotivora TaxID=69222 RepID=A0A014N6K8_9GAMM|nr:hypothetical protein BG55_13795 [Erwinia mallotivora]
MCKNKQGRAEEGIFIRAAPVLPDTVNFSDQTVHQTFGNGNAFSLIVAMGWSNGWPAGRQKYN